MSTSTQKTDSPKKSSTRTRQSKPHTQTQEVTMSTKTETSSTAAIAAPVTRASVVHVTPPDANVSIPSPRAGFVPAKGGSGSGVRPSTSELVAMPDAVEELRSFSDWAATLGKAAPPAAEMIAVFDSANRWSVVRNATKAWDKFSSTEEGLAWTGVRTMMATVKPLYQAAVKADASIGTTYPKLTALLGAKSVIARKAASTKLANKKEVADGKAPTHGAVGKKRQRAAAKAALAGAGTPADPQAKSPPQAGATTAVASAANGVGHA